MTEPGIEYLTTRELAALLRIKERKVYELAASGEVPCSRATGKLLFPRRAIDAWVARRSSGLEPEAPPSRRPNVFLGSHDPLLDWALRESRCGLATFFDGSLDGIERYAKGEGVATGPHVYAHETDDWNGPTVWARFAREPVVLIEFAWRDRGLLRSRLPQRTWPAVGGIRPCRSLRSRLLPAPFGPITTVMETGEMLRFIPSMRRLPPTS